ncbi:hypothetical protein QMT28_21945, partial [Cronobacter sakazakii]|nr:hypothetical protein [Cronobacter sakazakii]
VSWLVTFTLTEHLSVQEKREARATSRTASKTQKAGAGGGAASQTSAGEDAETLSWFERKILKPVNDALG